MQVEPSGIPATNPITRPAIVVASTRARDQIPKGVRKPVPSMLMRNAGGLRIKVLHRRAMNCLLAHAQMQDRLGIEPTEHGYEIPISDLESMLGFSSNGNRKFVVDLLEELTQINIKFDGEFAKGSMNVVGHIVYHKTSHLVTYSIDSVARSFFLRPERFAYLNIKLMQKFTSLASLMLFEFCTAFATSPGRRTPEFPWTDWSVLMSGSLVPHNNVRDFNKILVRSVTQVNQHWADFHITAHITKIGGRLRTLWFTITPNQQATLDLDAPPSAVSGPLRDRLSAFGLSHQDIEQMLTVHDEDYLLAQADYLARRLTRSNAPQVQSPPSFFRKAVESNYAKVSRDLPPSPPAQRRLSHDQDRKPLAPLSARDQWWSSKYAEARTLIESMTPDQKAELVDRFKDAIAGSMPSVVRSIKQHGVEKPIGLAVVSRLLAHSMFAEPDLILSA